MLLSITQRGAQKEPSVLFCLSVDQSCIFVSGLLAGLLSWCWTLCLSVFLSITLSIFLSICLTGCLSVQLAVCLFVWLAVWLDWLSDRLVCLHENFIPFSHYSGSAIDWYITKYYYKLDCFHSTLQTCWHDSSKKKISRWMHSRTLHLGL